MMIKKAVVVQCRLGSTRLKNKALKKIDEKTILEYVLNSMKNVDACLYYVLTDFASAEKLKPSSAIICSNPVLGIYKNQVQQNKKNFIV